MKTTPNKTKLSKAGAKLGAIKSKKKAAASKRNGAGGGRQRDDARR